MDDHIPNERLDPADIPGPDAPWDDIQRFALTFSGYRAHGSFEACADIANARRHSDLTDLRTCLFFEQRRWRHFMEVPSGEDMAYIRGLVEKIREHVQAR